MDKVRSLVRPILTLSGWGVMLFLALTDPDVRTQILTAVVGIVAYWFGERKHL